MYVLNCLTCNFVSREVSVNFSSAITAELSVLLCVKVDTMLPCCVQCDRMTGKLAMMDWQSTGLLNIS